jgi:anti-anti-sigma regulatory factor
MAKTEIIHKTVNGILFLSFEKEELKLEDAEKMVEIVFDLEENWEVDRIVMEFAKVDYVNSSMISAISRIADAKDLKIVQMTEKVKAIMDTMGILPFLDVFDNTEDALKDFET